MPVIWFSFAEINPYPYLMSFLHNEIVLLDMDQNQVVWTFLAKGDISALGYIADDGMGYFAQGDSLFLLNLRNHSGSKVLQLCDFFECGKQSIYVLYCPIIKTPV